MTRLADGVRLGFHGGACAGDGGGFDDGEQEDGMRSHTMHPDVERSALQPPPAGFGDEWFVDLHGPVLDQLWTALARAIPSNPSRVRDADGKVMRSVAGPARRRIVAEFKIRGVDPELINALFTARWNIRAMSRRTGT